MITISIDLKKIDQSRCKKTTRKNGEAASFCNLVLIETPNGEYGDFAVKQEVTKEEREAGVKLPFIGNGRNVGTGKKQAAPPPKKQADPDLDGEDSRIPF